MRKLSAIDLFAGAGGLSLGLTRAGFDVRLAVEYDPIAVQTYRRNLGEHVLEADIHTVTPRKLLTNAGLRKGECDLLAGGPPCQGFSVQRRGSDEDDRNDLVLHFARLVLGVAPKMFLMENVAGLLSTRGRPFLERLIAHVDECGYDVDVCKVEAADFGVPQMRSRVLVVGRRRDLNLPRFSLPTPSLAPDSYVNVRQAIGDLPSPPSDGKSHPDIANHARESRLSQTNLERLKHIPPGGGREHLPPHLQLPCHLNNPSHRHMDVYGRLDWERPSGTITARFDSFTRGRFAHPEEDRSLTLREGARLQTFPDNFVFVGNREEGARQIGNAVPVLLAAEVGAQLGRCLTESVKRATLWAQPQRKQKSSNVALPL
jgi:DNA (cytosine-5)-methyltransferase 1